jgi:hypothetical protein
VLVRPDDELVGGTASKPHGIVRLADGTLRWFEQNPTDAYPQAFVALVMSMIEADEHNRILADDALAVLHEIKPRYNLRAPFATALGPHDICKPLSTDDSPAYVSILLPDAGSVDVPLIAAATFVDNDEYVVHDVSIEDLREARVMPVLLRHTSGVCRLLLIDSELSIETALYAWPIVFFRFHIQQRASFRPTSLVSSVTSPVNRAAGVEAFSLGVQEHAPRAPTPTSLSPTADAINDILPSPAAHRPALGRAPSLHHEDDEDDGAAYKPKKRGGVTAPVVSTNDDGQESVAAEHNVWVETVHADDDALSEQVKRSRVYVGGL